MTREFTDTFPESTVFRAIHAPPEDPLQGLAEDLEQQHEATREIFDKVRSGELPLGTICIVGRTYTEAVVRRAAGMVRAHDHLTANEASQGARRACNGPVVVDISALGTLALLPGSVVDYASASSLTCGRTKWRIAMP